MASFLSPLLKASSPDGFRLVDARTGQVLADRLLTAFDSASRRTGLLKHTSLPEGTAMIIAPCSSIHTFFMKFPIDVVFVAKDGRVLKVRRSMSPWRISASLGAFAVVEMSAAQPAGNFSEGSVLSVRPESDIPRQE